MTPGELVVAYFRGFGDELATKEFNNSKLGKPYIGDGARINDEMIAKTIRDHTMSGPRPSRGGQRLITMGMDQGKTGHVVVCDWQPGRHAGRDISGSFVPKVVWMGKFSDSDIWKCMAELMVEWQVLFCVMDADPELSLARTFCRRFDGFAATCRYRSIGNVKEIVKTEDERGAPMLTVDRTCWLDTSLGRFKTGRIELPRDTSDDFKLHVKNLVRTYERVKDNKKDKETSSVATYVNLGPDHYAHALNYAEIALQYAPRQGIGTVGKVI